MASAFFTSLHSTDSNWTPPSSANCQLRRLSQFKSLLQLPFLLTYLRRAQQTTASSESESYVTTDGQSASLPWNKTPVWDLWPDFYSCQTVAGLFMWGVLSDERTSLLFTIAAGFRQRSHQGTRDRILLSQIWDFPFCRLLRLAGLAAVEEFDPASTRNSLPILKSKSKSKTANSQLTLSAPPLWTDRVENTISKITVCLPIRCLETGSSIVSADSFPRKRVYRTVA
jgi:hypothetical protein